MERNPHFYKRKTIVRFQCNLHEILIFSRPSQMVFCLIASLVMDIDKEVLLLGCVQY